MKNSTVWSAQDGCIGLDLSDKEGTFVVLDKDGRVVEEGQVPMALAGLQKVFGGRKPTRLVIETGTHSPWVSRSLMKMGHEVIVANSRQIPLIFRTNHKNDRLDAIALARLARVDPELLRPVTHRGEQAQKDLAVLRSRDALVKARTALINHVRGVVKSVGGRLSSSSAGAFASKAVAALPEGLETALNPVLETIASLTEKIAGYDREVERLAAESYPGAGVLRQVNGVGPLTSLAYVLTLEDPRRFRKSRDVGAFLGLTPKQRQSGNSNPQLHITKAGDAFLRRLLVQCAHYVTGPFGTDCDLRRWGLKLAGSGVKTKKRAVTAVARKLAVLLHRLWLTGEVYEPFHASQISIAV
jgi:transposase